MDNNTLIKLCFERNKHFKHIITDDHIKQMTLIEKRFPLTKLPVCGACEKLAMWGNGMQGICRSCGTITKNPITYSEYLASGYDIDSTGATAKCVLREEKKVREIILPDEYNGFAKKVRERYEYGT